MSAVSRVSPAQGSGHQAQKQEGPLPAADGGLTLARGLSGQTSSPSEGAQVPPGPQQFCCCPSFGLLCPEIGTEQVRSPSNRTVATDRHCRSTGGPARAQGSSDIPVPSAQHTSIPCTEQPTHLPALSLSAKCPPKCAPGSGPRAPTARRQRTERRCRESTGMKVTTAAGCPACPAVAPRPQAPHRKGERRESHCGLGCP